MVSFIFPHFLHYHASTLLLALSCQATHVWAYTVRHGSSLTLIFPRWGFKLCCVCAYFVFFPFVLPCCFPIQEYWRHQFYECVIAKATSIGVVVAPQTRKRGLHGMDIGIIMPEKTILRLYGGLCIPLMFIKHHDAKRAAAVLIMCGGGVRCM